MTNPNNPKEWNQFTTTPRIYTIQLKKHIFTPHEIQQAYTDEDIYITLGDYILKESIILPNKEILLGVQSVYIDYNKDYETHGIKRTLEKSKQIEYYNLKDILLIDITDTEEYEGMIW